MRFHILVFRPLAALTLPLLLASCGGDGGDGGTDPVVVAQVAVTPSDPSVEDGETIQLSATPRDAAGDPLDRAVSWSSANPDVAAVSQSGLVTGADPGSTRITATSEGVGGFVTVTVTPIPVVSVSVLPDSVELSVGGTAQLAATPRDDDDDPLTGRPVVWASSDTDVATVSSTGLVTGVSGGMVTITATVEGVSGEARAVVTEPVAVAVDSIVPARVVEGSAATIHGFGFATTPAGNLVTVDGMSATVLAATETRLDIMVPETGCRPAREAPFRVGVGSTLSPVFMHPLRPEAFLSLDVGEQVILPGGDELCLQFDALTGAEGYLVGVQSTSNSMASVTPSRLSAVVAPGLTAPMLPSLGRHAADRGNGVRIDAASAERWSRHRAAEARLREAERPLLDRLRAQRRLGAVAPTQDSPSVIPPDVEVGDTLQLRINDDSAANLCTTFFTVDALVRVIGTRGVWLTDVSNPAGGYSDADLEAMSTMFDDMIYATDVAYFGEPSDLDGNDRIAILTTRRVNATEFLGFVFTGDFLDPSICPSSNYAEIYYGMAPDPGGEFGPVYSLADAKGDAPGLIAHEFAHLLQVSNEGHDQAFWEAEGQASFAEEVVGFAAQGRAPGNNYGIHVAFNPLGADSITWHAGDFTLLAAYFGWPGDASPQIEGAPEQCSWLAREPNGPCLAAQSFGYGVSKALLRFVSDQFGPAYPGGEQGLHRDLITTTQSGFDAIEAVTGLPIETVLARWAASLYVDDRFEGMDPTLEWSSWNLFDIFESLVENARLHPRARAFAAFSDDASVRAASTAYFTISGSGRPATAIEAASTTGAPLPGIMQVWVVRVE